MLPQFAWAADPTTNEASLDGTTLTITSTKAGNLDNGTISLAHLTAKSSITKIVLWGKFNDADLLAIKGNDGSGSYGDFTGVTEVDMADAKFVSNVYTGITGVSYKLFASTPSGSATIGDHAFAGGALYRSTSNSLKWNKLNYTLGEGTSVAALTNENEISGHNVNDYGKISSGVRYLKLKIDGESRNWEIDQETYPEETPVTASFDYDYRNNHLTDYNTDGQWVQVTVYTYYQLLANGPRDWESQSISEGESKQLQFIYADDDAKTADTGHPDGDNQYAIVGGTEYVYNGTTWLPASEVSDLPKYDQMKFTYWKGTLTKAVTSKYADENISEFIFDGCNLLTEVDYKGGNVTGFIHISGTASSLTVKIGKNVTKISSGAFNECEELSTLIFDTQDYSTTTADNVEGVSYPREMVIEGSAFLYCHNLTSTTANPIVIPNRVSAIGDNAFKEAGGKEDPIKEIYFEFERRFADDGTTPINGYNNTLLTIGSNAFSYCKGLKHISMPIRMTNMGDGIFQNSGLESFEIREDIEDAKVTTIPTDAFLACKLRDINIPRSVTEIKGGAFSNTPTIKTIRFQKQLPGYPQTPLIIRSGAFSGGDELNQELKDVYVDFTPEERLVVCEYNAFNFTSMVGQTNVANAKFAKLHFPDESWNYYQGDWKRGLAFKQTNLTAYKDGYNGKFGGIESESNCTGKGSDNPSNNTLNYSDGFYRPSSSTADGDYSKYVAPANGWQQFVYSDTEIEIEITRGSFMRTYSTNTAYVIPTFAEDDNTYNITAGEPMFKIYRITAFTDGFVEGVSDAGNASQAQAAVRKATATNVEVTDKNGYKYIPKETGLLMVGEVNADYVAYFANATFDETHLETSYPYELRDGQPINMLYPTCIAKQNLKGDGTDVQTSLTGQPSIVDDGEKVLVNSTVPYPYYDVSEVQFRFFGYNVVNNQFRRVKGAKFNRDKAYLKLPASLFHWTCEYTGDNTDSGSSTEVPSSARIALNFIDDEEGETTGIKQVNTILSHTDSNVFYTLEGVRLNARPTQRGIYIHNGRKIIIK